MTFPGSGYIAGTADSQDYENAPWDPAAGAYGWVPSYSSSPFSSYSSPPFSSYTSSPFSSYTSSPFSSFPFIPAQPPFQIVESVGSASNQVEFDPEQQLRRKTPSGTIDAGYDGTLVLPQRSLDLPAWYTMQTAPSDLEHAISAGQPTNDAVAQPEFPHQLLSTGQFDAVGLVPWDAFVPDPAEFFATQQGPASWFGNPPLSSHISAEPVPCYSAFIGSQPYVELDAVNVDTAYPPPAPFLGFPSDVDFALALPGDTTGQGAGAEGTIVPMASHLPPGAALLPHSQYGLVAPHLSSPSFHFESPSGRDASFTADSQAFTGFQTAPAVADQGSEFRQAFGDPASGLALAQTGFDQPSEDRSKRRKMHLLVDARTCHQVLQTLLHAKTASSCSQDEAELRLLEELASRDQRSVFEADTAPERPGGAHAVTAKGPAPHIAPVSAGSGAPNSSDIRGILRRRLSLRKLSIANLDLSSLPWEVDWATSGYLQPFEVHSVLSAEASIIANAKAALDALASCCTRTGMNWKNAMLMCGCLLYGLKAYPEALRWFQSILTIDESHFEAVLGCAASLTCLERPHEAEPHWLRAIRLRPHCMQAVEHVVAHWHQHEMERAITVINVMQTALSNNLVANELHRRQRESHGYALPSKDKGRLMALIHAKGTMLRSTGSAKEALQAFEENIDISTRGRYRTVTELIRRVQSHFSSAGLSPSPVAEEDVFLPYLLVTPAKARLKCMGLLLTSRSEFRGITSIRDQTSKHLAAQMMNDSLLSLASIYQDAVNGSCPEVIYCQGPCRVSDVLALYHLSSAFHDSPSTANNVGALLAAVEKTASLLPRPARPSASTPRTVKDLARDYYRHGQELYSQHAQLFTNMGGMFKDIGDMNGAMRMYERAVACDGKFEVALTNLAHAVKEKGNISQAIVLYCRAERANPNSFEAVCGLFVTLGSVCDWRGRGGAKLHSRKYDRWHVDAQGRLLDSQPEPEGSGLTHRIVGIVGQQLEEAALWGQQLLEDSLIDAVTSQLRGLYNGRHFNLRASFRAWAGKPWAGARYLRLIERAAKVLLRESYLDLHVTGKQKSPNRTRLQLPPGLPIPPIPTMQPFDTFTCALEVRDIRRIAQCNATRAAYSAMRSLWPSTSVVTPPPPPNPSLNVGYVSSDFNNHPLAHLMQSVFGMHDPSRVRAVCYSLGADDGSIHRRKIQAEAAVFRDVRNWSNEEILRQIIRDGIHVLVNLNGYTRGARNEIFAARPAPIQMSFMGYAGSLGGEWCDYILADQITVPPSTLRPWRNNRTIEDLFQDGLDDEHGRWIYSENIIYCRDTFFCCDHAQSCDPADWIVVYQDEQRRRLAMREKLFPDLSSKAVILGNFNQLYKIDPTTYRTWLRVLQQVPDAYLWLLRFPEPGEQNLLETARRWHGAEVTSRILFTDVVPKEEHLARCRVCDLFLDTPECNAHTTAADVLWSSTPVLTYPRYPFKMCSRIATSILRSALPKSAEGDGVADDLIVHSDEEYERVAVELAGGRNAAEPSGRLGKMRHVLWMSKWTCPLFNTQRWVRDVETAYHEAWRCWVEGIAGDIFLSNL